MKLKVSLLLLLTWVYSKPIDLNKLDFGPKIGYSLNKTGIDEGSNLSSSSSSFRSAFQMGGFGKYTFYKDFFFQGELLYFNKSNEIKFTTKGLSEITTSDYVTSHFINIPLLVGYQLKNKVNVNFALGFTNSICLAENHSNDNISAVFSDNNNEFKSSENFGNNTYSFKPTLEISGEYKNFMLGVGALYDFFGNANIKSEMTFNFTLGYKIKLSPSAPKAPKVETPVYKPEEKKEPEKIVPPVIKEEPKVLKLSEIISSNTYSIDYDKNEIYKIAERTDKKELRKNIKIIEGYHFEPSNLNGQINDENAEIFTNNVITIYENKDNTVVGKYKLNVYEYQIQSAHFQINDSNKIIKQTEFAKTTLGTLTNGLNLPKQSTLEAFTPVDKTPITKEDEEIINNSTIKLTTGSKNTYDYIFKTRYKKLEEGKKISVLDTIDIETSNVPIVLENILYKVGTAEFKPEAFEDLNKLVEILKDNKKVKIEISSHSSYDGDDKKNMQLSIERAKAVVDYLVKNGIDQSKLKAKGCGETQPAKVSAEKAKQYPFLKEGIILDEKYIKSHYKGEQAETAKSLSRRTEINVIK